VVQGVEYPMKAMILKNLSSFQENTAPLELVQMPDPVPKEKEILVRVTACGVCHTELDEIEGRTPPPRLPLVPGHQVVGEVRQTGPGARRFRIGERVGIGWIYASCGNCAFCLSNRENLCPEFVATGRDVHGGYAELIAVPETSAFAIPDRFSDVQAAPLLCAGAIGYRSLRLTQLKNGQTLALTGFGASAHLVLKLARHLFPESRVFVFARSDRERAFALELGAAWSGDTTDRPPVLPDAIIDTTPVWKPVVEAMAHLAPGGRLVINAVRKEDVDKDYLLRLDYAAHLWLEREIKSVANVTRTDIGEFLELAAGIPILPEVEEFGLEEANRTLQQLKEKKIRGAKVLRIGL
jgi:alcohol dehydrogenase, propanol-preferring